MRSFKLTTEEVLLGYDAVCTLYPHVPPLSHWRAWEYAAYQKYQLNGRILDLGCGDGSYFKLLWPHANNVIGVDIDSVVAEAGKAGGAYQAIHVVAAHQIPEADATFDHVFANCSLEHMDRLDEVLSEIFRCLKPGGTLLCSVVTNRFIEWSPLPALVAAAGFDEAAQTLQGNAETYHHLANPLQIEKWQEKFAQAGLITDEHIPILPRYNSGAFLLMDSLWHVKKRGGGEIGDLIFGLLSDNPRFPAAFRNVFAGFIGMENDWQDCSGAVFLVRKPGAKP